MSAMIAASAAAAMFCSWSAARSFMTGDVSGSASTRPVSTNTSSSRAKRPNTPPQRGIFRGSGARVITPQTSAVLPVRGDGCRTYLHETRVEPVLSPTTVPGEAVGGEVLRGYLLILTSGTPKPANPATPVPADQPQPGRRGQPS